MSWFPNPEYKDLRTLHSSSPCLGSGVAGVAQLTVSKFKAGDSDSVAQEPHSITQILEVSTVWFCPACSQWQDSVRDSVCVCVTFQTELVWVKWGIWEFWDCTIETSFSRWRGHSSVFTSGLFVLCPGAGRQPGQAELAHPPWTAAGFSKLFSELGVLTCI